MVTPKLGDGHFDYACFDETLNESFVEIMANGPGINLYHSDTDYIARIKVTDDFWFYAEVIRANVKEREIINNIFYICKPSLWAVDPFCYFCSMTGKRCLLYSTWITESGPAVKKLYMLTEQGVITEIPNSLTWKITLLNMATMKRTEEIPYTSPNTLAGEEFSLMAGTGTANIYTFLDNDYLKFMTPFEGLTRYSTDITIKVYQSLNDPNMPNLDFNQLFYDTYSFCPGNRTHLESESYSGAWVAYKTKSCVVRSSVIKRPVVVGGHDFHYEPYSAIFVRATERFGTKTVMRYHRCSLYHIPYDKTEGMLLNYQYFRGIDDWGYIEEPWGWYAGWGNFPPYYALHSIFDYLFVSSYQNKATEEYSDTLINPPEEDDVFYEKGKIEAYKYEDNSLLTTLQKDCLYLDRTFLENIFYYSVFGQVPAGEATGSLASYIDPLIDTNYYAYSDETTKNGVFYRYSVGSYKSAKALPSLLWFGCFWGRWARTYRVNAVCLKDSIYDPFGNGWQCTQENFVNRGTILCIESPHSFQYPYPDSNEGYIQGFSKWCTSITVTVKVGGVDHGITLANKPNTGLALEYWQYAFEPGEDIKLLFAQQRGRKIYIDASIFGVTVNPATATIKIEENDTPPLGTPIVAVIEHEGEYTQGFGPMTPITSVPDFILGSFSNSTSPDKLGIVHAANRPVELINAAFKAGYDPSKPSGYAIPFLICRESNLSSTLSPIQLYYDGSPVSTLTKYTISDVIQLSNGISAKLVHYYLPTAKTTDKMSYGSNLDNLAFDNDYEDHLWFSYEDSAKNTSENYIGGLTYSWAVLNRRGGAPQYYLKYFDGVDKFDNPSYNYIAIVHSFPATEAGCFNDDFTYINKHESFVGSLTAKLTDDALLEQYGGVIYFPRAAAGFKKWNPDPPPGAWVPFSADVGLHGLGGAISATIQLYMKKGAKEKYIRKFTVYEGGT